MKTLTVLCNVVFFTFTCLVLATDGTPKEAAYIILTLVVMLIPIFTVFAILRGGPGHGWPSLRMKRNTSEAQPGTRVRSPRRASIERVAAICNVVMLGFICWAFVDQYPHPEEEGFVEYVVLSALTPILSALVLLRSGRGDRRQHPQLDSEVQQG